jgi:uncharacterized protein (DUF3084 family)
LPKNQKKTTTFLKRLTMFDKEKLKVFGFGAATIGIVWLGFGLKSKNDNLQNAMNEINAAREILKLIKTDLTDARTDVASTRKYLDTIRIAAITAKNDLSNLQRERESIYKNIDATIESSKKKLKDHQNSIEGILNKQKSLLESLDAIAIKNVHIQSSKEMKK